MLANILVKYFEAGGPIMWPILITAIVAVAVVGERTFWWWRESLKRDPQTLEKVFAALEAWSVHTGAGEANLAPGVIFAEDDDIPPDVIWISHTRRTTALGPDGHLHAAPELVVEILSPGTTNERRDREAKLKLYSRRGVLEYWIVDWRTQQVEVYRREELALRLVATLYTTDTLTSPLLLGFACEVATLF